MAVFVCGSLGHATEVKSVKTHELASVRRLHADGSAQCNEGDQRTRTR